MRRSLSRNQAVALSLLTETTGRYGLELVRASGGRLKRGAVYVTLTHLEDLGFVTSTEGPGKAELPRRLYTLTEAGGQALAAYHLEKVRRVR